MGGVVSSRGRRGGSYPPPPPHSSRRHGRGVGGSAHWCPEQRHAREQVEEDSDGSRWGFQRRRAGEWASPSARDSNPQILSHFCYPIQPNFICLATIWVL